jgi:hypothetical protein
MPMCTIQTDGDSSFELHSYGTSDNIASKTSAHEVNAHHEAIQPTLPLTLGDHQDDQSAQGQSVDRFVKLDQNQIAQINMDIAAIHERIASLELPNSKAKPESIKHLYKMIARLSTCCAEHVQEIQQCRSAQFSGKQIKQDTLAGLKSKTPSQDVNTRRKGNTRRVTTFNKWLYQIQPSHKLSHKTQPSRTTGLVIPQCLGSSSYLVEHHNTCYRELIGLSHAFPSDGEWRLPWRRQR